ncbi:phage tail protein [Kitasatospora sp. NPDC049285]|uniref:phage tail protein n=1 Tax=Kitasatospora sp. NPDC049285 TaxID=3157096 RepID=UPI00343D0D91
MELEPGLALNFGVRVDGVEVATFSGISGMEASYEEFEWPEGGDNSTVVRLPGRLSCRPVQLHRNVDEHSARLASWFGAQQRAPFRRTAVIELYDTGNRKVVARWTLVGALPVRYTGPRLTTTPEGETVAVETLELSFQGFKEFSP